MQNSSITYLSLPPSLFIPSIISYPLSDKTPSTSTVEPQIPGFRAPGEIATNYEVATGTERYEYLKKLAGEEPWAELKPIHLTSRPTKKDPFVLHGSDPVRYIGCTGKV